jgi:[acyl-carrier-protein] S-malonyltransferase
MVTAMPARKPPAFLFPGQGSHAVGMGRALAAAEPAAGAVFSEVDEALGFRLSQLCFEGPLEELTLTANQQPALLATSVAALRVLEGRTDVRPIALAGHSLGEWSALVAAGALSLRDAARLVHLRGKLMQEAVPAGVGAMAAIIGLGNDEVAALCREVANGQLCSPANLNGGGQVVIAGHAEAVDRAVAAAKPRGAKLAKRLAVSAPFHCALMQPAAEKLAAALAEVEIRPLAVPVVTNVEAEPNREAGRVRELLTRQVTAPVRWEESVRRLQALGVGEAVELGAGRVLAGLVKRIAPGIAVHAGGTPEEIAAFIAAQRAEETHA